MKKILVCSILLMASSVQAKPLMNGLGGVAGFGENSLAAGDDHSSLAIDITSVFSSGLSFYGTTYNNIYVNTNGNVTLKRAQSPHTPSTLTDNTENPMFAPYFADVDTTGNGSVLSATAGGNSTGSNLVHWDLDTSGKKVTITWDDVGYYKAATNRLNAFQLILSDQGSGDFGIEFRYEDINWTTGDGDGGSDGLGGTASRAGWSSGNGTDFFEFSESGDQAQMLNLENTSNVGEEGVYRFNFENGEVSTVPVPAAVWFFGSGLIGLVGIRKKSIKI